MHIAVVWSGFFNFLGVVLSTGAVAFGIVSLLPVELILQVGSGAGFAMVFALLVAAILWNLGTWCFGLPASSSHTLIGSIIGVGIANQLMSARTGTSGVDWAQAANPEARACWIAGFSFGAWIGMQLLMRRPEVEGFLSIAAPASLYDFSFLAPCPSSGLFVHGEKDAVVPVAAVHQLVEKLKTQKGIVIEQQLVKGANHFFDGKIDDLMEVVNDYLDRRLPRSKAKADDAA